MAIYLDTSVLVPLFFRESASEQVRTRVLQEDTLWISRWTLAEFSSATAFKLRSGQSQEAIAEAAREKLNTILVQGGLFITEVMPADLDRATQFCAAHASGLRTPDALHAAIAVRMKHTLLTADAGQAAGCRYHGIPHELLTG